MGRSNIAVLAVIVLAFVSCSKERLQTLKEAGAEKSPEKSQEASSTVRVISPEVRTIHRYLEYTGSVEPVRQVRMVPEITAKVQKLYVDDGDHVEKGQVLARFDTKIYQLQKKQASAALHLTETQVKSAEKEMNRMQPLAESGAVSQQQLDQLESGLEAARAGMGQAEAALALASYSVKQSRLVAPFDGIVTNVLVNEGEYVGPQLATYGMLTLVDIATVKVKVGVTERDLPLVKEGLVVEVVSDAYPERVFLARVATISPSADLLSKSFPVEVELENPDEMLKAGMFVRIRIHVESAEDALVVPAQAIVNLKDRQMLYVVTGDGRAIAREVTIGIGGEDGVQILTGEVSTADRVIVEGNFGLKDGARVLIAE